MTSLWSSFSAASRVNPEALHESLAKRLQALEEALPRLAIHDDEVSLRDMVNARSRTALSCKLDARLLAANSEELQHPHQPSASPASIFFGQPELLEHALSFVKSPEELARVGAVCSVWYIASRSAPLWEAILRASGRLDGPHPAFREVPHEDEWTTFETAARIQRHGCRPVDNAPSPHIGRIDEFVDDLGAYQVCGTAEEETLAAAAAGGGGGGGGGRGGGGGGGAGGGGAGGGGGGGAVAAVGAAAPQGQPAPPQPQPASSVRHAQEFVARHATKGDVVIRSHASHVARLPRGP